MDPETDYDPSNPTAIWACYLHLWGLSPYITPEEALREVHMRVKIVDLEERVLRSWLTAACRRRETRALEEMLAL